MTGPTRRLAAAALVMALVALPRVGHACAVCFSGESDNRTAFLVTTDAQPGPTMELWVEGTASPSCEVIVADDDPYLGWYFPAFLQVVEAPVIVCRQRERDAIFITHIELHEAAP